MLKLWSLTSHPRSSSCATVNCSGCLSNPLLAHRIFAKLNVAHFARKYPAVQDAFLKSLLEVSVRYHKTLAGEEVREGSWVCVLQMRVCLCFPLGQCHSSPTSRQGLLPQNWCLMLSSARFEVQSFYLDFRALHVRVQQACPLLPTPHCQPGGMCMRNPLTSLPTAAFAHLRSCGVARMSWMTLWRWTRMASAPRQPGN